MGDLPVFEEVISSQTEVLEAEQRLHKLEAELGANPTEAQLAAVGRARDAYEMLGGYSLESKVRSVLFGLGFTERDMTRSTTEFSGGWQMRIALAKLLIRNPEVLLARRADEPPGLGIGEVARGLSARVCRHGHRRLPRPRLHGQHGRPRGGNRQRGSEPVQGQLLEVPGGSARSAWSASRRSVRSRWRRSRTCRPSSTASATRPPRPSRPRSASGASRRSRRRCRSSPRRRRRCTSTSCSRRAREMRWCGRAAVVKRYGDQHGVRRHRLHDVPRRQGGARGPQRRGQIHALEDDRRGGKAPTPAPSTTA